jgi:hypothetical protein
MPTRYTGCVQIRRPDVVKPICNTGAHRPAALDPAIITFAGTYSDLHLRQGRPIELDSGGRPGPAGFPGSGADLSETTLIRFLLYLRLPAHARFDLWRLLHLCGDPPGQLGERGLPIVPKHYDRVGHLAFGFFPIFIIKEVLLRVTSLRRGGWFYFLVLSVILAAAAFYEFIEWWSTYLVAPEIGAAFLGSQGDPWDTQWDMFLALVGTAAGLAFFGRLHDRSMEKMF